MITKLLILLLVLGGWIYAIVVILRFLLSL
jgi:hypothetical protein